MWPYYTARSMKNAADGNIVLVHANELTRWILKRCPFEDIPASVSAIEVFQPAYDFLLDEEHHTHDRQQAR